MALNTQREIIEASKNEQENALNKQFANVKKTLKQQYDTSLAQLDKSRNNALREAYIAREQNKRTMPGLMAAQGVSGGASETALSSLMKSYQAARNSANDSYNTNKVSLDNSYMSNLADSENNYLNNMATLKSTYLDRLAALKANEANTVTSGGGGNGGGGNGGNNGKPATYVTNPWNKGVSMVSDNAVAEAKRQKDLVQAMINRNNTEKTKRYVDSVYR